MKGFIRNIFKVAIGNGTKLVSSVLIGLLLPMIFDPENYGYYRLYIMYNTYFAIFHFGFTDGVFLHLGGKTYIKLDKNLWKAIFKSFALIEVLISISVLCISVLLLSGDRQTIMIMLSINLLAMQMSTLFQMFSQALGRFHIFTVISIIQSVLTIALVILFFVFDISNYQYFLVGYVLISYFIMVSYVIAYRDMLFINTTNDDPKKNSFKLIFHFLKLGGPLLIANLVAVLITNTSRQFVEIFFDIETFGIFSFSFSLMNLTNIFITAMSIVVYPTLSKINTSTLKSLLSPTINNIISILLLAISIFFPLKLFVLHFVPQYQSSIPVLSIIMPSIVVISTIQIVKLNYFKAMKTIKVYLLTALATLLLSVCIYFIIYYYFNTIEMIAYGYVLTILVWYIVTDIYFIYVYKINTLKNFLYIVLGIVSFYTSIKAEFTYIGLIFYILFFVILFLIFGYKDAKKLLRFSKNNHN